MNNLINMFRNEERTVTSEYPIKRENIAESDQVNLPPHQTTFRLQATSVFGDDCHDVPIVYSLQVAKRQTLGEKVEEILHWMLCETPVKLKFRDQMIAARVDLTADGHYAICDKPIIQRQLVAQ